MNTRTQGTLIKWNDARGFGFIELDAGKREVFAHISAFPRDGVRPQVGECISFEIAVDDKGKQRALRIARMQLQPNARQPTKQARDRRDFASTARARNRAPTSHRARSGVAAVLILAILGTAGIQGYRSGSTDDAALYVPAAFSSAASGPNGAAYKCDGRTTCGQMRSCDEARFFLNHCPNTQMDGDNDGEPCEQQWCE